MMTNEIVSISASATLPAKPEIIVETRILNPNSDFAEKRLCDGPTFSPGSACFFTCTYCYTESMMNRGGSEVWAALKSSGKPFQGVVIRRAEPLARLRRELEAQSTDFKQKPLVIYTSPAVDVAATEALAKESAELCCEILSQTAWQIRMLSKSPLIQDIAAAVPTQHKGRVIFGLSTGTLDDEVAKAVEPDAPPPSKRLEALRELQAQGFRTFAMLCPILPQEPVQYAGRAKGLIDFGRCEHVWAEVLNRRGKSMEQTAQALEAAHLTDWAQRLRGVFGPGSTAAWEAYARSTFAALSAVVAADKFRFLQYVTDESIAYWTAQQEFGAILLGEAKNKQEQVTLAAADAELKAKRSEAAKKAWVTIRKKREQQRKLSTSPALTADGSQGNNQVGQRKLSDLDLKAKRSAAAKKAWVTIRRKSEAQKSF